MHVGGCPGRRANLRSEGSAQVSTVASCRHCGLKTSISRHPSRRSGLPKVTYLDMFNPISLPLFVSDELPDRTS